MAAAVFISSVFNRAINNYDKITAVISHVNPDYEDAYIDYSYDGESYTDVLINSYSSSMKPGRELVIYVNPENPLDITVRSTSIVLVAVFGGLGAILVIVGALITLVPVIRSRKYHDMIDSGQYITGTIKSIYTNEHVVVNGVYPINIIVSAVNPYTGKEMTFKTKNLYDDVYSYYTEGEEIKVYYKDEKFRKYQVDLSKLGEE